MASNILHEQRVDDVPPAAARCLTANELESISGGGSGPPPWQAPEPTCPHCPCGNPGNCPC
jgi:hypothetical protein